MLCGREAQEMKALDFLFSPLLSLFSAKFYRTVLRSSPGFGFLYLLYLGLIGAVSVMLAMMLKWLPVADEFVNWFSDQVPPVVLDQDGLSSSVAQPYEISHPKFGTLVILDTTKETVRDEDVKRTFFYVTKRKIYANDPTRNETRIMDVLGRVSETELSRIARQELDGEQLKDFYAKAKPVVKIVAFLGVLLAVYMWKLGAALFYSLAAWILNQFREEKYSYLPLVSVSAFALTPVAVLQFSGSLLPNLSLNPPLWMAVAITSLYLAVAILIVSPTEKTGQI